MRILIGLCLVFCISCTGTGASTVIPRLPAAVLLSREDWPTIDPKIVGGSPVTVGEFPYQISLQRQSGFGWSHICGGSIYSEWAILGAAHCVQFPINSLRIVAGLYSLTSLQDNAQTKYLSAITVHPSYNSDTSANDIAILQLRNPLTFNRYVSGVNLPPQGYRPADGTVCTVTGWGVVGASETIASDILRQVDVPIVPDAQCKNSYGSNNILPGMICAGFKTGGADSCQGDSGGPLVIKGTQTQVGIVSWGDSCALPKYYGVYTLVPSYIDWIENQTLNINNRAPSNNAASTLGLFTLKTVMPILLLSKIMSY